MTMFYEYLKAGFDIITTPIRNLWYSTYALFYGKQLSKTDKTNLINGKGLGKYITSNFKVSFCRNGMILTNKNQGLERRL